MFFSLDQLPRFPILFLVDSFVHISVAPQAPRPYFGSICNLIKEIYLSTKYMFDAPVKINLPFTPE